MRALSRPVVALALAFLGAAGTCADASATSPRAVPVIPPTAPCGTVLLPGSLWLSGHGVDVKSNANDQFSGNSCGGLSTSTPTKQYGYGFQCVELAARLYHALGWGLVYADGPASAGQYRYGAKYIPQGSPQLIWHSVSSTYTPVPGDLLIEGGDQWGHVAVVDYTTPSAIVAVEQNASNSAFHYYPLVNGHVTGGYSPVSGFLHSPKNHFTNVVPTTSYTAVFTSSTNGLATYGPNGGATLHGAVLPGSSPTAIALPSGGYRLAYVTASDDLVVGDYSGALNTLASVATNTDASITATASTTSVAYVGTNNELWVGSLATPLGVAPAGWSTTNWGGAVAPNTSPSVASGPNGLTVAYVGANGDVWIATSPSHTTDTLVTAAPGTSPAILVTPTLTEVAVTGADGTVWTIINGVASSTRHTTDRATSPALVNTPTGVVVGLVTPTHAIAIFGADGDYEWRTVTTVSSVSLAAGISGVAVAASASGQVVLLTRSRVVSTGLNERAGDSPTLVVN